MDVKVWLDELDVNGLLAPHALLSMFERGRSDALGVRGSCALIRFDHHWTRSKDICAYICKSLPPRIYIDSIPCNNIPI